MKKWIVLAALVGAAFYAKPKIQQTLTNATGGTPESKVEERVNTMLDAWQKGGTGTSADAQTALCQWAKGVSFIPDRDELSMASDGFDKWRRAKNLYRGIDSYEVVEVVMDEEAKEPTAYVTCEIDGSSYELVVREGKPIRWAS